MTTIQINKVGVLVNGDYKDWYIKIIGSDSGDFLIYTSNRFDFKGEVHDDWVRDENDLYKYFRETGWEISWGDDSAK